MGVNVLSQRDIANDQTEQSVGNVHTNFAHTPCYFMLYTK